MSDIEEPTGGNTHDYPAWGYLLAGVAFLGIGMWLLLSGVVEDSRRPLLPWFVLGGGAVTLFKGAQEWRRNRSLTKRRAKPAEERRRDEEHKQRAMRWSNRRLLVTVAVLVVGVLAALLTR